MHDQVQLIFFSGALRYALKGQAQVDFVFGIDDPLAISSAQRMFASWGKLCTNLLDSVTGDFLLASLFNDVEIDYTRYSHICLENSQEITKGKMAGN
mmetsp:Transcript_38512/g.78558  ORF Transcript_38512/g.78558 Transcript_38512/m.78558 type:complete len:97 (-) Transcript_38512:119-409(-)